MVGKPVHHIFAWSVISFLVICNCTYGVGQIFIHTEPESENNRPLPRWVIRQRSMLLNPQIVLAEKENISLNLFTDLSLTILKKKLNQRNKDDFTWIGKVSGDEVSTVVITVKNKHLSAQIDSKSGLFSIKPVGEIHLISEINPAFDESAGYIDEKLSKKKAKKIITTINKSITINNVNYSQTDDFLAPTLSTTQNDLYEKTEKEETSESRDEGSESGNFIDLMIIYSSDVANASADIQAELTNNIEYANEVLAKSCVHTRLRLVHSEEINYEETGYSLLDLVCLTTPSLSYCGNDLPLMQNIHTLRDIYGADLVQFWVENNTDACGIGWTQVDQALGFSVKLHSCGASSSIHEIGHNLSLSHDRYQSKVSIYNYAASNGSAYGHVLTQLKVRDIMSYNTECSDSNISCQRIGYFSNPQLIFNGAPLGIPGIADTVSRLNITRTRVANYRQAITPYAVDTNLGCEETTSKDKNSPCFIASAIYGNPHHPHVEILRNFKERHLLSHPWGKRFVSWYYRHSPYYAQIIKEHPSLQKVLQQIFKTLLTPVAFALAYENEK
ncbi:MAG: hypothetical protein HQK53_02095 [Oligoflexia bacterium]|nr:hypothetical protein [Oligoflexia bacterium]